MKMLKKKRHLTIYKKIIFVESILFDMCVLNVYLFYTPVYKENEPRQLTIIYYDSTSFHGSKCSF